jgi:hypothetical protein
MANKARPESVPQRISKIFFNLLPIKKRYLLMGKYR